MVIIATAIAAVVLLDGRLFEEAPRRLCLKSLVGFLAELCHFSHDQLTAYARHLGCHPPNSVAAGPPQTPLLLFRLGDVMSRCINADRPHLQLMRVWSIASSHFVEVC